MWCHPPRDTAPPISSDLDASTDFYEHVLELPVSRRAGRAEIAIGASSLVIRGDTEVSVQHHLTVMVPPKAWISERVDLPTVDGDSRVLFR